MTTFIQPIRALRVAGAAALVLAGSPHAMAAGKIVFAEVYGGGASSSAIPAPFANDFAVLFNSGDAAVNIGGYSIQYQSDTGSGTVKGSNLFVIPAGATVLPGQYYLFIGGSSGALAGTPGIPVTGDAESSGLTFANTAGKLYLVTGPTPITTSATAITNAGAGQTVVDQVSYGATSFAEGAASAPAVTKFTAVWRKQGGYQDTDNNGADFVSGAAAPLNSADFAQRFPAVGGSQASTPVLGSAAGSAAVYNGNVYFAAGNVVYGMDAATNATLFTFDVRTNGASASSTVLGRPALKSVDGSLDLFFTTTDGFVFRITTAGVKVWSSSPAVTGAAGVTATPAVFTADDSTDGVQDYVYVAEGTGTDARLVKLLASDGTVVRSSPSLGMNTVSSPVVGSGGVYVGVAGGLAGDVVRLSATDLTVMNSAGVASGEGVSASPFLLETGNAGSPFAYPVVYAATNAGNVYAFNASTGQLAAGFGTSGSVSVATGVALSSPFVWNAAGTATLYAGGSDNKLYALNAGTGATAGAAAGSFVLYNAAFVPDGAGAVTANATPGSITGGVVIDPARSGGPGAVEFGSTNGFFYQVPLNLSGADTSVRIYATGAPIRTVPAVDRVTTGLPNGTETVAIGDDEGAAYRFSRY